MHKDVIAVGVETPIENQWRVHKGTGVDKTAPLLDLHLLHVKHEASIEDLKRQRRLSTKYQDFVLRYLVCESHVGRHPLCLIN